MSRLETQLPGSCQIRIKRTLRRARRRCWSVEYFAGHPRSVNEILLRYGEWRVKDARRDGQSIRSTKNFIYIMTHPLRVSSRCPMQLPAVPARAVGCGAKGPFPRKKATGTPDCPAFAAPETSTAEPTCDSLPPCGGGLGWGVVPRGTAVQNWLAPQPLPHKREGRSLRHQ